MASFDALAEAYVRLRAKDDGSLTRDVTNIVGGVATSAAALFAGKKLLDVGVAGLDELKQAEVVTTQTAVQLKATGEAAGVSADHIDELGQKMLDLAGFDDEAARSAANVLLQFNQIKGTAAFDRVESDAADLAVTLGEDLPSAARTLGLALQDPEKGIRLLRAANVVLTASQKEQLAAAVAQNDVAKEQDIVLSAVEARVKGAAAAYGDTLAGSTQRATEELKNAKAELISGFAPAINFGATAATAFAHVVEEMPTLLQGAVGGVVFQGGGIASVIPLVSNVIQLVNSMRAARAASAAATTVETAAELANTDAKVVNAAATGAEEVASVGLLATLGPLGLALGVAAAGLTLFALNSGQGEKNAQALDNALQKLDTDLQALGSGSSPQALTSDFKTFLDQLVNTSTGSQQVRQALDDTGITTAQLAQVLGQGTQAAAAFVSQLLFTSGASEGNVRVLGDLVEKTTEHAHTQLLADVATGRLTQSQLDQAAATHLLASGDTDWIATLSSLEGAIAAAQAATDAATVSQSDQLTSTRTLLDAQQAYSQAQDGVTKAARGVTDAERGVEDADRRVTDSRRAVTDATQRLQDAEDALAKARQGASGEDLGKGQLDISDANLRAADSQTAVNDAEKQLEKDRRLRRSPATLAKDQEALTKAQNDLERAIYGVNDAQDAYNKLQQQGTDQDPAVISAQRQVADATKAVDDANRGVSDALRGVSDAQQRVIDAKDAVNAAYLTEADAGGKLADAQAGLFGATETVNTQLQNQLTAFQNIDSQLAPGSPARQHLDDYIKNLFVLAGIFNTASGTYTFTPNAGDDTPRYVPGRAGGGDVPAGWSGWVGEQDIEFLQMYPGGGGHVFTRQQANNRGVGASGATINFNGPVIGIDDITGAVRRELARDRVLAGDSVMNGG